MAIGAGLFLEKPADPLHSLLVLGFGEGVEDGIDRRVVGEVELAEFLGLLAAIKDVLLFHRAVVDDGLLFRGEIFEGDVGPDAHGLGHVDHEGPHEGVPGGDRPFFEGQALVGDEARPVDGQLEAGSAARGAGAGGIEGKLLGPGAVEGNPAGRADGCLHEGDVAGRRAKMPVGAAVAPEARIDEAEDVI